MSNIQKAQTFSLQPTTMQEAMDYSAMIANSNMVPKAFQGKPADVLVAIQMGAELGLPTMQAVQNIAVINGRPTLWGDGMRAVIMSQSDLVDFKEWYDENTKTAHCKISRKLPQGSIADFNGSFSEEDAKNAGLLGRQGPWQQYRKRMQQMRAFGFAARDAYAHALRGIQLAEEVRDYPVEERDITPAKNQQSADLRSRLQAKQPEPEVQAIEDKTDQDWAKMSEQLIEAANNSKSLDEINEIVGIVTGHDIPLEFSKPIGDACRARKKLLSEG